MPARQLQNCAILWGYSNALPPSEIAFQRKMDRVIDWTNKRDLGLGLTTRIVEYYSAVRAEGVAKPN